MELQKFLIILVIMVNVLLVTVGCTCQTKTGSPEAGESQVSVDESIPAPVAEELTEVPIPAGDDSPPGESEEDQISETLISEEILGYSVQDREIAMRIFGDGSTNILIFSAIHGDEPVSSGLIREYERYLKENMEILDGYTVWSISVMNPDGLALGTRGNANGIDLNRNFDTSNFEVGSPGRYFGGNSPLSEPESIALADLVTSITPARILTVHSPLDCVNFDGPCRELAYAMGEAGGFEVRESLGYATPGSFGSWAGIDLGIPVITLELTQTGWASHAELTSLLEMLNVFVAYE